MQLTHPSQDKQPATTFNSLMQNVRARIQGNIYLKKNGDYMYTTLPQWDDISLDFLLLLFSLYSSIPVAYSSESQLGGNSVLGTEKH